MERQVLERVQSDHGFDEYEIRMGKDGRAYCTCPAWRFKKTCKHLIRYVNEHDKEA